MKRVLLRTIPPPDYVEPRSSPTPPPTASDSTSSAETANWKTYTDNKLKITFSYPDGWEIKENGPSSLGLGPKGDLFWGIAYLPSQEQLTQIEKTYTTNNEQVVTKQNISHPEYKITKYIVEISKDAQGYGAGMTIYLAIIQDKDRYFVLESQFGPAGKETFDRILSTFKFIE